MLLLVAWLSACKGVVDIVEALLKRGAEAVNQCKCMFCCPQGLELNANAGLLPQRALRPLLLSLNGSANVRPLACGHSLMLKDDVRHIVC